MNRTKGKIRTNNSCSIFLFLFFWSSIPSSCLSKSLCERGNQFNKLQEKRRKKKTRHVRVSYCEERKEWQWERAGVIWFSVICLLELRTQNMLLLKERRRGGERERIPLIHLASLCCCLGPVVTSEIEDEHERELQRSPFTDSKKSAPNYSESKYQLKQAASPFFSASSRLPPANKAKTGTGWGQFESPSDGSNMALMLIRLVFWPAPRAFLPSRDSNWNVQLWQEK